MKNARHFTSLAFALTLALSAGAALAQSNPAQGQADGANRLTPQQREQVRAIMQAQHSETQQKLAGVLTPEQMAAWQAKRAEREQQHMGGRRGPGGMGGVNTPPPPTSGN
jgi:Spy/CpxP family protein refolding chaperone